MQTRRALAPAMCLVLAAACVEYTSGTVSGLGDGGPIGITPGGSIDGGDGGQPDGGDGGPSDGGDGGPSDGGPDGGLSDGGNTAGCGPGFQGLARDFCFGGSSPQAVPVNVSVTPGTCAVSFSTATTTCTGAARGTGNAFDGGCGSLSCASASLPGTVSCGGGASPCNIFVCGSGSGGDGGCGP